MARVGAVLLPRWDDKSFGNVDILEYSLEMFRRGYLGAYLVPQICKRCVCALLTCSPRRRVLEQDDELRIAFLPFNAGPRICSNSRYAHNIYPFWSI